MSEPLGESMGEKIRWLYYALWMMHPVLQAGIAFFMVQRRMLQRFKFFFAYIVTQIVSFGVIFPAYVWHSYSAAFYFTWACMAVSVVCGFLVIHEIFVDVFRMFHTLRDLGTVLFKWAGLVMLLVSVVVSVSSNSSQMGPILQGIVTAQRCVRVIQVGMVLFLLFFAHYVGVTRKQHSFGIALGFGSFAVIELILISSWVGNHLGGSWLSILNITAYNCSLGLWLGYVAVVRPARDVNKSLLQSHRWEQSLSDIQHPVPADSLIPMFEGMVDRALSHTRTAAEERPMAAAAGAGGATEPGTGTFNAVMRAASKT